MKTKKFLFLMVMFLFIVTTLMIVMPNKAFATETMSDEFRQILNEEGKFVVTDTTMEEDKQQFLNEYLQKYQTDSYWFMVTAQYDETHYRISRIDLNNGVEIEIQDIEIAFEEKISNEFKTILKDGKFQIPSSIKDGIDDELYICSMSNENYLFEVASFYDGSESKKLIDENYTKATIAMRDKTTEQFVERHIIELSYLTEPSEAFKTILKDGKLQVPSSTKDGINDILQGYLTGLSQANTNYSFKVDSYNENSTKVTLQMFNKEGMPPKLLEQHEVELSYLTEQSEEFKKELNKDGKLVFNSIKPSNEDEMYFLFDLLFRLNNEEKGYDFGNPSEDLSSMDLTINYGKVNQETHKVEVVYNYDKTVKQKLQGFVNNFPKDIEYFNVKDLELINYWVNNTANNGSENLDAYSGELKSAVNNNNIEYYVDNRAGDDSAFYTIRIGVAMFKYNGIIYHIDTRLGTKAENIIYVPDTTGNSKEELMAAAQKRIDEYLGSKGKVTISYAGTVLDTCLRYYYENYTEWKEMDENMTFEEYNNSPFYPAIDIEMETGIEGIDENASSFVATINGVKHYFLIEKNSAKMITPSYKTADMATNIEISTSSTSIPLDASIQAKQLTSGAEYDKIIKLLDVKEHAMFDLKLYSSSLEKYVTKLEDGAFEVKIPIPENLKGKKLVAYYTDGTGKPETYEVEPKDGYAIFKTKHFSIYTLAEIKANEDNKGDNNENKTEDNKNTEVSDNNNTETSENKNTIQNNITDNNANPKTGDNIIFFVGMLFVAVIGIIATTKFRKYNKK